MQAALRAALLLLVATSLWPAADAYLAEIEAWRREREKRLTADDGWLTVVGLFWLKQGSNSFGTDPSCDIVLPPGSAPPRAGTFEHSHGRTLLRWADRPGLPLKMQPDAPGPPTIATVGDLSLLVIRRGDRYAIRLRDRNSPFRKQFTGLRWYPVDAAWRVRARFTPYPEPRKLRVGSTIGEPQEFDAPGYLEFDVQGRRLRLEPARSGAELFLIFKDLTSGKTTYPAGRFLYAPLPKDGTVVLDFNKAFNPPCAFTPYTTCPLPPKQNHLPVAVEAGEKLYRGP
jgi:uncharacterized protein (DUF1684 family)